MPYVTEQNLTDVALERWKDIPDPRLRQVMQSLIKHLHGFVREIEPTQAEWFTAIDWLTRTGQMCSQKRQEFILTSDVLGVSMLVDAINHRAAERRDADARSKGPFHVPNAPPIAERRQYGGGRAGHSLLRHRQRARPRRQAGRRRGARPLADRRRGSLRGSARHPRAYMRGLYRTQPDGSYVIRTVAPIAYTIPMDGTVGELMNRTNISHMRPAHIHFAIEAPGYHGCVTHCSRGGDEYIETDVVYGVKEPLIVEFVKKPAGKAPTGETITTPFYEVKYDFVLQKQAEARRGGVMPRTTAAVPRRSCRKPAASRRPQGGARETRARRDQRRRAQDGRRSRDREGHQQAGSGRPQIGHRRRVPPRLLELRFPRPARRRRSLSRRAQDQVPGPAAQADDAARHRQARRPTARIP